MSAVYCPKCYRLKSERTSRCSKCGHFSPSPTYLVLGLLVISALAGACMTTLYAGFLSLIWDRWVLRFAPPQAPYEVAEEKARLGAILLGTAVFVVTTSVTALAFGARGERRRHRRRSHRLPQSSPQVPTSASDETRYG